MPTENDNSRCAIDTEKGEHKAQSCDIPKCAADDLQKVLSNAFSPQRAETENDSRANLV
jgi:hypothetical protein